MLFQQRFLNGIRDGTVTLAFRRWRRPTVKTGGTLRTPVGELSISAVARIPLNQISEADARCAGYESLSSLRTELQKRVDGTIYRIDFGPLRPDARIAMRESPLSDAEQRHVLARLERFDSYAGPDPWTMRTLETIRFHPGVRAGDLCRLVGQDKEQFKLNVRKLKNLGLTESLDTGYRLSPRGDALLSRVRSGSSSR